MRNFETGATRNSDDGKMQYARIFDPSVEKAYAEYMESQRVQADGKVRDPDNWKKGIPVPSYLDSQRRHWHDVWAILTEQPEQAEEEDLVTALCALKFNVDGMLYEVLKARRAEDENAGKPALCEIAHETDEEEDLCEARRVAVGNVSVTGVLDDPRLDLLSDLALKELLVSAKTALRLPQDRKGQQRWESRIAEIERTLANREAQEKHPEWDAAKAAGIPSFAAGGVVRDGLCPCLTCGARVCAFGEAFCKSCVIDHGLQRRAGETEAGRGLDQGRASRLRALESRVGPHPVPSRHGTAVPRDHA